MLTVVEVACIFHRHPATIRRWCARGKIRPGGSRNGRSRFRQGDVAAAYYFASLRQLLDRRRRRVISGH